MAEVQEEVSNPYNARKSWHTPDKPRMGDADGLFYAEQQATPEEAPEEEAQPRKRTNYKKRYDDLKKHYDQKLAEFKHIFLGGPLSCYLPRLESCAAVIIDAALIASRKCWSEP